MTHNKSSKDGSNYDTVEAQRCALIRRIKDYKNKLGVQNGYRVDHSLIEKYRHRYWDYFKHYVNERKALLDEVIENPTEYYNIINLSMTTQKNLENIHFCLDKIPHPRPEQYKELYDKCNEMINDIIEPAVVKIQNIFGDIDSQIKSFDWDNKGSGISRLFCRPPFGITNMRNILNNPHLSTTAKMEALHREVTARAAKKVSGRSAAVQNFYDALKNRLEAPISHQFSSHREDVNDRP